LDDLRDLLHPAVVSSVSRSTETEHSEEVMDKGAIQPWEG
jgi:hypothetical protein